MPYCLKVLSTWYVISIYKHKMKKLKRTATLDSFIIKKLKNISIAYSISTPNVDADTEPIDVNFN